MDLLNRRRSSLSSSCRRRRNDLSSLISFKSSPSLAIGLLLSATFQKLALSATFQKTSTFYNFLGMFGD